MLKFAAPAAAAILLLTGCGRPQASTIEVQEVTTPVLFRIKDQVGDKWVISTSSFIEAQVSGRVKFDFVMVFTCIGRSHDKVRYRITISSVRGEGEGHLASMASDLSSLQGMEMETVRDFRNDLIADYWEGEEIEDDGTRDASDLVFPEQAIKSGDTWEGTINSNTFEADVLYTFRGKTLHNGVEAYVIAAEFPPGQTASGDPGFEYIIDANSMRMLQVNGGFREGNQARGTFKMTGTPG